MDTSTSDRPAKGEPGYTVQPSEENRLYRGH
jgi:hypothetical protein